jgi:hypothetical protein
MTFVRTVAAEIAVAIELGEQPLAAVRPAPSEFWRMHKAAGWRLSIDGEALRIDGKQPVAPRIKPRIKIVEYHRAA